MKVPLATPTLIDLLPLGMSDTVLVPALILPAKDTSLAVIVTGELVVWTVPAAMLKLPVPSVVMITPLVP